MRYRFYVTDNKVICVSSYAGKAVRGVRCDYKIEKKRVQRARAKHAEATKALDDAREYEEKMQIYYDESFRDLVRLDEELKALEAKM